MIKFKIFTGTAKDVEDAINHFFATNDLIYDEMTMAGTEERLVVGFSYHEKTEEDDERHIYY